jgi:hypothetical protein
MKASRKTIVMLTLLLSVTTFSIVARNKRKDNDFKNLKVYPSDVSHEKLDPDMDLFSKALGVDCGFCHYHEGDNWDFASDKKGHKENARNMMRMTNELNEKYFGANLKTAKDSDLAMNCYTCHRGEEMPIIPWDTLHVKPKPISAPTSPWGNYKQ